MKKFKKASDIKVGVIGYGAAFNMGQAHINQMKAAGMTPTAVAEVDPKRLEVAARDFPGIETYTSVATMLKKSDVNFITIITPHNTHAKLGLQCLKAGRGVCCEKPLAITTEECDAMIAEARKQKVVLTTYHNRHWDGWILEAVDQIVNQKRIGEVVRIECQMGGYGCPGPWWRSSKSISGGILYDWGVHLLEYALQIIDSDMVEVFGTAKNGFWAKTCSWKNDTSEDEAKAVVRFKSGQWLSLAVSNVDMLPREAPMIVTGTEGTYIMNLGGDYKLLKMIDGKRVIEQGGTRAGDYEKFYQNVADHMTKGTKLVISPEWSRRPIHILDLADKSAKSGKAIKTKYA